MKNVIEPLEQRYPSVRFSHLNYIHDANPETIRVALAVARLFETDAYAAAPDVNDEIDPLYLVDFGRPLAPRVDSSDGDATYRVFENGIIAVSASREPLTIEGRITLPATDGEPRAFFFTNDR